MEERQAKSQFDTISALAIFFVGMTGGFLPLLVTSNETLTSFLNMFAGGILFAASVCHLLPDATQNPAMKRIDDDVFPLSFFVFGIGMMLILFLECIAHSIQQKYVSTKKLGLNKKDRTNDLTSKEPQNNDRDTANDTSSSILTPMIASSIATIHYDSVEAEEDHAAKNIHQENSPNGLHSVAHNHMLPGLDVVAISIFIGLSFHSIMEGMAVGAHADPAWDIFFAILAHKGLAAFALGLELIHHGVDASSFRLCILLFSLMTPMGILIGSYLIEETSEDSMTAGICTALAGGTFLYVAVIEILPQEMQSLKNRNTKCVCFFAGYLAFGILGLWI